LLLFCLFARYLVNWLLRNIEANSLYANVRINKES